jgi:hypothetical protein
MKKHIILLLLLVFISESFGQLVIPFTSILAIPTQL